MGNTVKKYDFLLNTIWNYLLKTVAQRKQQNESIQVSGIVSKLIQIQWKMKSNFDKNYK